MLPVPFLEKFFDLLGLLHTRYQVLRHKVAVAPITFGPSRVFCQRPRQSSFIEWHPCDYCNVHFTARWKQLIFRILIEDVINHLHRIYLTSLDGPNRIPRLPSIYADTDSLNQFLTAQIVEFVEPTITSHPIVAPCVELDQIEAIEAGILKTAVDEFFHVVWRIRLVLRRTGGGGALSDLR